MGKDDLGIIGASAPMEQVREDIRKAAAVDVPVLIEGETGTGKELVANAIHAESPRMEGPFVPVNIGSLPESLGTGELVGHERGAFTGATRTEPGRFEQADGGTLFLDEIGTADGRLQVALLQLIEGGAFYRLGGSKPIAVDVRLIAATNRPLPELVTEGTFREDLLFRLDVFRIHVPPLRERGSDVLELAERFVARFARKYGRPTPRIASQALHKLETYEWPGNVRELENILHCAVICAEGDPIRLQNLPPRIRDATPKTQELTFPVGTTLEQVERRMVLSALQAVANNRQRASDLLGISRRSLYNKLKLYGVS